MNNQKQKLNEIWKLINNNAKVLNENFVNELCDNTNKKMLRVIGKECKHKKGTITQTDYDVLNGFTVIRSYCIECHKLLITTIYKTKGEAQQ